MKKLLKQLFDFVNANIGGLWNFGAHHPPIITPNAYRQMEFYGITYKELIGAFHSSHFEQGKHLGSTCGIANYYGKVVGAVYKRDDRKPTEWAIIACWAYHKKTSDYITGRRYWQSWKWGGRPKKWRTQPFKLF